MNYVLKNLVAQNSRKCDEVCDKKDQQAHEQTHQKFKQRRSARKPRVCGADEWMIFFSSTFRPFP
jgi:hypothetical protein